MMLVLLDIHMQTNEGGTLPHTIYKNELKGIKGQNVKAKAIKLTGKNGVNKDFARQKKCPIKEKKKISNSCTL